jgi:hypothetical protein
MADPVVSYPFDPTGQASTNRIVGEPISVLPPGDRLFHYAMPKFAPFFEEGLVVKLRDLSNNVITLTKGVDFYLSHKFMDASLATMHPIWGSISFLRRDIAGTLIVDYNTLGGIWTIDSATITEILVNTIRNPRITSWEQVVERPVDFPVIDHVWNLDDMVGQKEILEVLQNFYTAYLVSLDPASEGGGGGIITDHINNKNNPHQVTAAQVGAYSTIQMDTKLGEYLPKTGTAVDSTKFDGITMAQLMDNVANTKVQNAVHADNVDHASTAGTADNASKLESKSLAEIMQDVATATVANATKFAGKTYAEATVDILAGKSADSAKLEGKTLNEIIAQLQQSSGDASTLSGKTLTAIMNDVKTTEVNLALRSENADNSSLLGGKSLGQILDAVAGTIPDLAHNSERVYGYTFDQLIENFLQNPAYVANLDYRIDLVTLETAPVIHTNDGGSQDANYRYVRIGSFPIPTTLALNGTEVFDPAAKQLSVSMSLMFYFEDHVHTLRAHASVVTGTRTFNVEYFSDTNLGTDLYLGIDNSDSTMKSEDGTKTAKNAILYAKIKSTVMPRAYGAFLPLQNYFALEDPDVPLVYDSTCKVINPVTWKDPAGAASGDQVEFDQAADSLNALLVTPAA